MDVSDERTTHGPVEQAGERRGELDDADQTQLQNELSRLNRDGHQDADMVDALMALSEALVRSATIEEVSSIVLEQAKRITSSRHGFVGYIDPGTGHLVSTTMTRDIWNECRMEDKTEVFEKFCGLWGWVLTERTGLLTNDLSRDPRASGVPEGHIPIRRFLSAPAMASQELLGQIALANSDRDYTEQDMRAVKRLAGLYGLAVQRVRSEDALRASHEQLEQRVQERTAELAETVTALQTQMAARERAEYSMRQSSELLEKVFSNIYLQIAYLDANCNFIRVNRSYAEHIGCEPEFFPGKNLFDLCPDPEHEAIFRRVVETGEPFYAHEDPFWRVRHPSHGVEYWDWSLQPIRSNGGTVEGLILSLLNVSYRRWAEEEVKRLFSLSTDLFCVAGFDGYFKRLNPAWEKTLGYTTDELIARPYIEFIHPDDWSATRETEAMLARGEASGILENRFRCRDGSYRRFAWSMAMLAEGLIYGVARDVTEQRWLEEELLDSIRREQQRIGRDLHDVLGQNLTGIAFRSKLLADRLAEKGQDEAEDAADINRMVSQAVSQARSLSRGLCPVDLQAEGLTDTLEQYAAGLEDLFDIECEFRSQRPPRIADSGVATHLYYIVTEATNNAVKHGKASRITISLEGGDRGLLDVSDNGVGLPENWRQSLGMGLKIMEYRARMIGGSLEARGNQEGGTSIKCIFHEAGRSEQGAKA